MRHFQISVLGLSVCLFCSLDVRADLLGYWSADSSSGTGTLLVNDQGNSDLDGEIFGAEFTADGDGHTGLPGDYAVSFPGEDDDYVVIPATDETFEEITITAWVNGLQLGAWAGLVVSRTSPQPIGLDFHDFDGTLTYIWNDNSAETWGFISDVAVPEDEWTLVALTIDPEKATLYAGVQGGDLEYAVNEIPHFPQDNFAEWRWAEDDGFAGARNFSGLMDDVSIWNEALSLEDIEALHSGAATPLTLRGGGLTGDYNNNGALDSGDLDLQSQGIKDQDLTFDLNGDGTVDYDDRVEWVHELKGTWIGDADFSGEFTSGDLVDVFTTGKYETGEMAGWTEGDWDGDMLFDSGDFVAAFSDGGYELGPRPAAAAVPEPTGFLLPSLAVLAMGLARRRLQGERARGPRVQPEARCIPNSGHPAVS